jgi:hypothetical protein
MLSCCVVAFSLTAQHEGTPLHVAVANSSRDIVQLLVQHGADTRAEDQVRCCLFVARERFTGWLAG